MKRPASLHTPLGASLLIILFFGVGNFFPLIGHAATQGTTPDYVPLAPIPELASSTDTCNPLNPSTCAINIKTYIPNLIKLIIGIAGALAAIMIVIGGVQYLSTDALQGKEDGREKIQNAIYGLLLAIGAYMLLNTINPGTLSLDLLKFASTPQTCQNGSMVGSTCVPKTVSDATKVAPKSTAGNAWPLPTVPGLLGVTPQTTDSSARTTLANLVPPISVVGTQTSADCSTIGQLGCTSLDGISDRALRGLGLLSLRVGNSGALLQVNGGTEYWDHCVNPTTKKTFATPCTDINSTSTVHKPGLGGIDLQAETKLNNIIMTQGTPAPGNNCQNPPMGAWNLDGAIYTREDSGHWHVCYGGP